MKNEGLIVVILLIIIVAVVWVLGRNNKSGNNTNSNIKNEAEEVINQLEKENDNNIDIEKEIEENYVNLERESVLDSEDVIELVDENGNKTNYYFEYNGEKYTVTYKEDNWQIVDSYKITNRNDMAKICQALLDEHNIHGSDMKSYRTVEDMVYEWVQHNIAYVFLSEDNEYKLRVKDVDFDPADQNKSVIEMYEARTGKTFNISDYL